MITSSLDGQSKSCGLAQYKEAVKRAYLPIPLCRFLEETAIYGQCGPYINQGRNEATRPADTYRSGSPSCHYTNTPTSSRLTSTWSSHSNTYIADSQSSRVAIPAIINDPVTVSRTEDVLRPESECYRGTFPACMLPHYRLPHDMTD